MAGKNRLGSFEAVWLLSKTPPGSRAGGAKELTGDREACSPKGKLHGLMPSILEEKRPLYQGDRLYIGLGGTSEFHVLKIEGK